MSRYAICALVALLTFTQAAPAQVLYGSVVGNVTDSSGGAIPDASVSVRQSGTGLTRQTQTNEAGQFQFPTMPGGVYEITVTKAGFTTFSSKDVNVSPKTTTASRRFRFRNTTA